MVLDPFSALGLASNIVQFVDFGIKLISESRELYKSASGVTIENEDLRKATESLQHLCDSLFVPHQTASTVTRYSKDEECLRKLTASCKGCAFELLFALKELTAQGPQKKWQSFRVALKSVRKKDQIQELESKLLSYRSQLGLHLMAMSKDQQSDILTTLRALADENRRLGVDMARDIANLKSDILSSIQQLANCIVPEPELNKSGLEFLKLAGKTAAPAPEAVDFVAVSQRLAGLAEAGNTIATGQMILGTLQFKTMNVRYSKIPDAHPNTVQWMFSRFGERPDIKINFVEWLQSNDKLYWISGKPGSGKSVLMKYLVGAERTAALLRSWAGPKKLVTASFFFWIAGTEMQKSQEGLFRSLLYEVLRQCPELIPSVFPLRWQARNLYHDSPKTWTRSELLEAFTRLGSRDISSTCFCFFIDGLDEYEGDHSELVEVLKDLVDSSSVKICLSSRPWNVFEAAFGNDPILKLYLQDLNKVDIRIFVKNKLEDREDFRERMQRDERCNEIVAEIVEKSKGVFLWVYLVIRSLVQGLNNSDRISDLQRRLREFPEDLEKFFLHIFMSLDPIYRQQAARAFHTSLQAAQPLSLLNYWFLDEEEEDSNFAVGIQIHALDDAELYSRQNEMRIRLNGRCKGLLEVSAWRNKALPFKYHVDFLHRTVKDFLMTKDMQDMLAKWTNPNFNADLSICRTTLAEIKSLQASYGVLQKTGPLSELVEVFMFHTREVEVWTNKTPIELLDELERVISYFAQQYPTLQGLTYPWECWVEERDFQWETYDSLFTFSIERNLMLYVQQKLGQNPRLLTQKRGRPLLDYALRTPERLPHRGLPHVKMATILLDRGADPNQEWAGSTIWGHFLLTWLQNSARWPQNVLYFSARVLLLYDANQEVSIVADMPLDVSILKCQNINHDHDEHKSIRPCQLFKHILSPDDAAALDEIMRFKNVSVPTWTSWIRRVIG